jgi:hypothetical protein
MTSETKGKRISSKQYAKMMKQKDKQAKERLRIAASLSHPNPVIVELRVNKRYHATEIMPLLDKKDVQLKTKDEQAKSFWVDSETGEYKEHGGNIHLLTHSPKSMASKSYAYHNQRSNS